MLTWKKADIGMVLPEEINSTVQTINKTTSDVKKILDLLKETINAISSFSNNIIDPTSGILNALTEELESVINAFFASGFHIIYADSFTDGVSRYGSNVTTRPDTSELSKLSNTPEQRDNLINNLISQRGSHPTVTPIEMMSVINNSLYDIGDHNRPALNEDSDVAVLNIMVIAPDINSLIDKISFLSEFFSLTKAKENLLKYTSTESVYDISFTDMDIDYTNSLIKLGSNVVSNISRTGQRVSIDLISGIMLEGLRQFVTYYISSYDENNVRLYRTKDDIINDRYIVFNRVTESSSYGVKSINTNNLNTTPTNSVKPDWNSVKFTDLSGVSKLYEVMISMLDSIRANSTPIDDSLDNLSIALVNKIDQLQDIIDNIQDAINDVYKMSTMTGIYLMYADSLDDTSKGYQFLNKVYSTYQVDGDVDLNDIDDVGGLTAFLSVVASTASPTSSIEAITTLYKLIGGTL